MLLMPTESVEAQLLDGGRENSAKQKRVVRLLGWQIPHFKPSVSAFYFATKGRDVLTSAISSKSLCWAFEGWERALSVISSTTSGFATAALLPPHFEYTEANSQTVEQESELDSPNRKSKALPC